MKEDGGVNTLIDIPNLGLKKNILDTAQSLVYGDRNKEYGHPIENFDNIAMLWTPYLRQISRRLKGDAPTLSPTDIACMNILQKIARLSQNQTHIDSIVDIAGYAATIERIITGK